MARRPAKKTIESRLTAVERGIRSLQANDTTIITIIKDMQQGFARMESRLEGLYNYVDAFVKLHETLDIEFRIRTQDEPDRTLAHRQLPF